MHYCVCAPVWQMAQELGLIPEDPDYVNPFRMKELKVVLL